MARIALVHDHIGGKAGGGGGVRLMVELAVGLERLGHRVTLVYHDFQAGGEFGAAADGLDIRAVVTGKADVLRGRGEFMARYLAGMRRVAKLVPGDVDVVNAHESPGLGAGRLAAARLGVPLVWTRNDETIFERAAVPDQAIVSDRRILPRLARAVAGLPEFRDARRAAAVVVLSQGQRRMVERSYRRSADLVPMGPPEHFFDAPDRAEARRRLGVDDDTFLCVGAGILYPHRRLEDLIDAVARIRSESRVRALIVGSDHGDPAYADRLAALIRRHRLEDRVAMPRRNVTDDELKDAYAAADVFVFPNQRQTWGLAPLEALACGTPVILSRGAGVHEVLEGRPGVVSVPPETPEAIAAALLATIHDRDRRAAVAETRGWIRRELSREAYARRMTAIYERVRSGFGAR